MNNSILIDLVKFQAMMIHYCITGGIVWENDGKRFEQVQGVQALLCWNCGKDYVVTVLLTDHPRPVVVKLEYNMLVLTKHQIGVEFMPNSNIQERLDSIQYSDRSPYQLRLQTVSLTVNNPGEIE